MKKSIFLLVFMLFVHFSYAQWATVGSPIDGAAANDKASWSLSLSGDGQKMAIGAPYNDASGVDAGHVRVYEQVNGNWQQLGADINGAAAGDLSGRAVSLSQDGLRLAIGASNHSSNRGQVRIFEWNGTSWQQMGLDIDGENGADFFGKSVSLSHDGSILAASATGNDDAGTDAGHVRIFEWNGTSWQQKGSDVDGEGSNAYTGNSVSISADGLRFAVGATGNDGNGIDAGHVRIFEWNGTDWQQMGSDIDGEAAGDELGWWVSLSGNGNRLAAGGTYNDGNGTDAGHARIFEWNGTSWQQMGADIDGEAASDFSGRSVSLNYDGSRVAVGSTGNDANGTDAGDVRVFEWNGTSWQQFGPAILGEFAGDFVGHSVALDSAGQTLAISATGNDNNGNEAGQTQVFQTSNAVAITSIQKNTQVKIYPQPATSFINIEAEGLEAIYLYNHLGQLLKMQTLQSATNVYQLELQNYPAAVYYITILSKEGKYSQKVILR
ncbi:T9SS type A sorting domain-containing protein [Saprospira sp. CCB-QB6]|uniref:T9SS type A sorting domain-containing protein n=1 Tax=Saprospira sp. CCB-QB6 TaxID=3023936 RepID=UPI00234B3ED9|nr:T9SS type A sorting domain-containing protein [Saprospira sp. CCB-QB6]WCL82220.1 T9SS type A sorting domain-containing protein [Saprospira sp. CCB-QB6]